MRYELTPKLILYMIGSIRDLLIINFAGHFLFVSLDFLSTILTLLLVLY